MTDAVRRLSAQLKSELVSTFEELWKKEISPRGMKESAYARLLMSGYKAWIVREFGMVIADDVMTTIGTLIIGW